MGMCLGTGSRTGKGTAIAPAKATATANTSHSVKAIAKATATDTATATATSWRDRMPGNFSNINFFSNETSTFPGPEHLTSRYRPISNTWYCLKENEAGVPVGGACQIQIQIQVNYRYNYRHKYKYK